MSGTRDLPPWLGRAWRIRAVILAVIVVVFSLLLRHRLQETSWAPMMPLFGMIAGGLALWADWGWLKRNHHRVNEWGLSKGKHYRKKPK